MVNKFIKKTEKHRNDDGNSSSKKRNNMIWIKMINYEIIHSSFMFGCSRSHELFPVFTVKEYQQFWHFLYSSIMSLANCLTLTICVSLMLEKFFFRISIPIFPRFCRWWKQESLLQLPFIPSTSNRRLTSMYSPFDFITFQVQTRVKMIKREQTKVQQIAGLISYVHNKWTSTINEKCKH